MVLSFCYSIANPAEAYKSGRCYYPGKENGGLDEK